MTRLRNVVPLGFARQRLGTLLLLGLMAFGLTGCYTQLAVTERNYTPRPDRVVVERYDGDSTVVREYYYERGPYYYRRYFARFYGDPFFYYDCFDPWYYDPFYCDPFYYPSFRFRLSFYWGDPFFFPYHGYAYWFYGFGYYSPYYWAYYPVYYGYVPPGRRVVWNYAPRGSALGRDAWVGRSPRTSGRNRYDGRDDTETRSVVRTTPGAVITPRGSSTGVEGRTPQSVPASRSVSREQPVDVHRSNTPRATTGRSVISREAGREAEGRAAPPAERPAVTRQPADRYAPQAQPPSAPQREERPRAVPPSEGSRSSGTRQSGNREGTRDHRSYQRQDSGSRLWAPTAQPAHPERSSTTVRPAPTPPRVHQAPTRPSSPPPRLQSAPPARTSAPAVRSSGSSRSSESSARGGARRGG